MGAFGNFNLPSANQDHKCHKTPISVMSDHFCIFCHPFAVNVGPDRGEECLRQHRGKSLHSGDAACRMHYQCLIAFMDYDISQTSRNNCPASPTSARSTTSCIRGLTESNRSKSTNHKVKQKQSYLSQTFSNYVVHVNIFEFRWG